MMTESLLRFVNGNLFEASSDLLSGLHVNVGRETAATIQFADYYDRPIPKYLHDVLDKVEDTYFIGVVTDLPGYTDTDNPTDIAERLQGKYSGMFFFAVDISDGRALKRSEIASLTRGFNRISRSNPVVLFIRRGGFLTLSTCERTDYKQQWREGEKLGKVSMLRDIKCSKPHPGHLAILKSLADKQWHSFDELYEHWTKVFSTKLLTNSFYEELCDWYAWATGVARFPNDITSDTIDDDANNQAIIRMITRLIFVWFLYCKHLIPAELFDKKYIREHFIDKFSPEGKEPLLYNPNESKYYRTILQNLFFATLNCPISADYKGKHISRKFCNDAFQGKRSDQGIYNVMRYKRDFMAGGADEFLNMVNSKVPFLNGGLFECLDNKSADKYYDGFSESKASLAKLHVPDYLFFGGTDEVDLYEWYGKSSKRHVKVKGIIDLFKEYYFTVEENTPLEQEVSLDPELLGKVFENLLAAYIPETGTSVRKMTASYYTPREIVQYMVDESLVAHLKRICGEENEAKYRALLSYSDEEVALEEDERKSIMNAIYNCRILDPACGSGAFPMGLLQQMVHVLKQIDSDNKLWRKLMEDQATEEARLAFGKDDEVERRLRLEDIDKAFDRRINAPDYARKIYLIERCLYGVDIQPVAIQISKLRFFISLVVDQRPTSDAAKNFGIRPLPNLEAKFVAANTLIPVEYDRVLVNEIVEVRQYKEDLKELYHKVFLVRSKVTKDKLKAKIKSTRQALADAIKASGFVSPSEADKLVGWDMFDQNTHANFFDSEWMLGVKEGFDIVIANPPYVQIKRLREKNEYKTAGYHTFDLNGDLYCLFYEFATRQLINNNGLSYGGTAAFITSNKWLRANYGDSLRMFMVRNANPSKLIDLGPGVFDAAVDTCIMFWSSITYQNCTKFARVDGHYSLTDITFVNVRLPRKGMWNADSFKYAFIRSKIERISYTLASFDVELDYGILTGANKAFILTEEKARALIALDGKNREIIKPILRGQDIGRYCATFSHIYLLCSHNGVRRTGIPPINIERDYPTLVQYFNVFGEDFKNRGEQGDTFYNLRNCAYIMKYEQPKIIYADIVQDKGKFYYDEEKYYTNDTAFIISGKNLKYLVGVLNSTAFSFFYKQFYCGGSLGRNGLRFKRDFLLRVPVPKANSKTKKEIENLAIQAFKKRKRDKNAGIKSIESRIDFLVYHLYGLTYDEVLIIDPQTSITREEYEKEGGKV